MNNNTEEPRHPHNMVCLEVLKKQVEIARKAFEEHPSIRTGSRYGDALNELSEATKTLHLTQDDV